MWTRGEARRAAAVFGFALVIGTVAACGGDDDSGSDPTRSSAPTSQAPGESPTVELLEAGAEPRAALRFKLTEGAQFRATVTSRFGIEVEVDGEPAQAPSIPPLLFDMATTVNTVASNGDIEAGFVLEDFRVGDGATLPAEAQASLDRLSGITGTFTVTSLGESKDSQINIPPGLDETAKAQLESVSSQFAALTVPFPEEPVGVGGSWKVSTSTTLNDVQTDLAYTYTLRERTGDRYQLDVSYEQTAPDQDVDLPGLPAGSTTHVDGVSISGSGTTEGDLTSFFPAVSTVRGNGTIDMTVDDGQTTGSLRQILDITIDLRSTR